MKRIIWTTVIICILFSVMAAYAAMSGGTQEDPVISLSYLDNVFFNKVKDYIDQKLTNAQPSGGTSTPQPAATYKVVKIEVAKSFIAGEGCEFILRSGTAKAITTEKGGIADTTSGTDLKNTAPIPANHLLIVPLADGRGFKADTEVLVMVKGSYSLK